MAAKPKWALGDALRAARATLALATEHKAALEPRLPAGTIDVLTADTNTLDEKQGAATLAKESLREATRTQDQAATAAHGFLTLARSAIERARVPAAARAAFGMSLRPTTNKISTVLTALDRFIDGATRHPDVAAEAGLLSIDIEKLRGHRAALSTADADQESTKESRTSPRINRDVVQVRVEKAIDTIINAGVLAFADNAVIVARFRGLVPRTPAPKKKKASQS